MWWTFHQSTVRRFCQVLIETPLAFKGPSITSMTIEAGTHVGVPVTLNFFL
jgi:hypothetical protein